TIDTHPDSIRIILTAYTDIQDLIEAINLGYIYRYITKPFDENELRITVKRALESYELSREKKALLSDLKEKNRQLEEALEDLRRAQEELLRSERMSTLGRAVSYIFHDLKGGPLTGIRGIAQMWELGMIEPERQKSYARQVIEEVDQISEMTQEILDFAKGGGKLRLTTFNLDELFRKLTERLCHDGKWSKIRVVYDSDFHGEITADAGKIRRIFCNIARNALDAIYKSLESSQKSPEEACFLISVTQKDDHVVFKFSDSGEGIPAEFQGNIFETFYSKKEDGTGLGLSIVKKFVEDHRGSIEVHSVAGKGTTFTITLPIHQPEENVRMFR
ncbi:MAG: sensor histidine kinase, partial [Deltaproteobacteria bacterium]